MTERGAFSLADEPWIAVLGNDGRSREVSLRQLFVEAPDLRTIAGELPTQDVAILRLCLAILHRALQDEAPDTVDDIAEVLEDLDSSWSAVVVPAVMAYLDRYVERFDLFDPVHPFFQVAGMRSAKGDVSELSKLIADMPAGRPFLTSRSATAAARVSAAEAARWLVHLQAYDTSGIKTGVVGHPRASGGKVYPEGVAWTGQLGLVHLVGPTLQQTLLLNLWATYLPEEERERDVPPWERPPQDLEPSADLLDRPAGPVDLYTWQPRRVLLERTGDDVTGVLITYGDRFLIQERQRLITFEPMTMWRYSKPQTSKYGHPIQMPRTHQPNVALWRGLATIVPRDSQRGAEDAATCGLVEHAARVSRTRLAPGSVVRYRAVGVEYGPQSSVVSEVIEDSLDLPATVLDPADRERRATAIAAVESAREGVRALGTLARSLARAAGAGIEEVDGPMGRAQDLGYSALDQPYRLWLRTSLADASDMTLAERDWHRTAWRVLAQLGEELVTTSPAKAWRGFGAAGRREDVGLAYQRFRRSLGQVFPRAWVGAAETDDEAAASTLTEETA